MQTPGRISAAIEVLDEITKRNRPASEALPDWGKAHRFAGSSDRHVIGTLVYDALRNRNAAAQHMQGETARGLALGTLALVWAMPAAEIAKHCNEPHGPGALSEGELQRLSQPRDTAAPDHVQGNYPQWLDDELAKAFGTRRLAQTQGLAVRAPIDLRVNTLKATRDQVLQSLVRFNPQPTTFSPWGIRIQAPGHDARHTNVEAEPAHGMGHFEVQDEASQVATLLSGAAPGQHVLDLCAGAGGKTLALAALMKGDGTITAFDRDRHRLRPIFERITRSGAGNINVVSAGADAALDNAGGYDLVLVDAPCTGSGTWRRKPDAKWRLTPKQLEIRLGEQREVLEQGAKYVGAKGRLAYFTCSVLPSENMAQVRSFLRRHPNFKQVPVQENWRNAIGGENVISASNTGDALQLTPHSHGTDGFFVSLLENS